MNFFLTIILLLFSLNSFGESAQARATLQISNQVIIVQKIIVNKTVKIRSNEISASPNQMIILQTSQGTLTSSTNSKGSLETHFSKDFEIFF